MKQGVERESRIKDRSRWRISFWQCKLEETFRGTYKNHLYLSRGKIYVWVDRNRVAKRNVVIQIMNLVRFS